MATPNVFLTVTIAAGRSYWSDGMRYNEGETLDVMAFDAIRGRYHGVFEP